MDHAYSAVNRAVALTYWNVGKRIVEQEGNQRAEYGTALIEVLATELTKEFGKGFTERNLRNFRQFYLYFPNEEIWNARVHNLNWTHIRLLLRVPEEDARLWYMNEAAHENWSVRTLDRVQLCLKNMCYALRTRRREEFCFHWLQPGVKFK